MTIFIWNILNHDSCTLVKAVQNALNVKVEIDLLTLILFLIIVVDFILAILFLPFVGGCSLSSCSTSWRCSSWQNKIVIMDWDVARVMLRTGIIKITLILTERGSRIMLHYLRWTLPILLLLNHIAYLHLYLLISFWIRCTNRLIHKHRWVWIESLEVHHFLDFDFMVAAYLVWLDKTLFLTDWKWHFLKRIIVVLLLKLIRIRICRSGLTDSIKLLISRAEIIGTVFILLAHLSWTFNFKHVKCDIGISGIKVVNFITIMFGWHKDNTIFILQIFKCLNGIF